jgi:hypothetical protein
LAFDSAKVSATLDPDASLPAAHEPPPVHKFQIEGRSDLLIVAGRAGTHCAPLGNLELAELKLRRRLAL